jgi:hypothetical protein
VISVEPLGDGAGCHGQGPAPGGGLDRLEVHSFGRARTYERLDFGDDLDCERRFEAPFLNASCEVASGASNSMSAHSSQALQYASSCCRNR